MNFPLKPLKTLVMALITFLSFLEVSHDSTFLLLSTFE